MQLDDMEISHAAEAVISALIVCNARRATKFIGPHLVVKLTRQRKIDRRSKAQTYLLTVGAPNYLERKFIKARKKAKEPFPVEQVQIKDFPKPRKAKKK